MKKCAKCGRVYSEFISKCPMCGEIIDAVSKTDKNSDYPFSHGIETERDSGFKTIYAGPPVSILERIRKRTQYKRKRKEDKT